MMDEDDLSQIEPRLAEVLHKERREAIRYAIVIVICTPFFAALASFVVVAVLSYIFYFNHFDFYHIDATSFYTCLNGFLAFMVVFILRYTFLPDEPNQFNIYWIISTVIFFLLLFLTYGTELKERLPGGFGFIYTGIGFSILGLLGKAYLDIPVTEYDERANPFYAFILAMTGFIAMAYGELFSSSWLWVPPKPDEIRIGAWILRKLATEKAMRLHNYREHGRALNFLLRLKLVKITEGTLETTEKGSVLIGRKFRY